MTHLDLEEDDRPLFERAGWNVAVWWDTEVRVVVNPEEYCCYSRIYSQGYLDGLDAESECRVHL